VLVAVIDRRTGDLERDEQFSAKPLGLRDGTPRQLAAADARWEPQIVLDPRTGSSLASGCVSIQEQRSQSFRRTVNSPRKPRWAGTGNHQVVQIE
jgi:hypothetical protein